MNYDILLLVYKLFTMTCGILSIFLGYKLFCKGIFSDAGELNGKFGENQIILKKAAPGTFFTLFGCIIICYSIFTGYHTKTRIYKKRTEKDIITQSHNKSLNIDSITKPIIEINDSLKNVIKKENEINRKLSNKINKREKKVDEFIIHELDTDGDGVVDNSDENLLFDSITKSKKDSVSPSH